jgi:hypothetical protein
MKFMTSSLSVRQDAILSYRLKTLSLTSKAKSVDFFIYDAIIFNAGNPACSAD